MTSSNTTVELEVYKTEAEFHKHIVKSIFNSSACSDMLLKFNAKSYFLLSHIVKVKAPKLFSMCESLQNSDNPAGFEQATPTPDADEAIKDVIKSLTRSLLNKTVHEITDSSIKDEILVISLEFMYGKPLDGVVTLDNCDDFYLIADKFGMDDLKQYTKNLLSRASSKQLAEIYSKMTDKLHPMFDMCHEQYMRKTIQIMDQSAITFLTRDMSYDMIIKLLSSDALVCSEDFVFELADGWCNAHIVDINCKQVMSHVKLENLSTDLLFSKVRSHPHIEPKLYVEVLEKKVGKSTMSVFRGHYFGIGIVDVKYPGYRLTTQSDFTPSFLVKFKTEYLNHNGIISLDDTKSDIVVSQQGELLCDGYYLRTVTKNIKKNEILTLATHRKYGNELAMSLHDVTYQNRSSDQVSSKITGLFVSESQYVIS